MGADGVRHPQGCSGRTENRRRRREVCQPQTPGNNVQPKANKLFDWAVCLALILVTVAIYWQVAGFDFVNYDDDLYVYENAHVKAGLTLDTVKWAFTAVVVGNWMPVTLLSHILDSQLFGMQSGAHHIVNVLIHALSSVFLYLFLRRATGARGASAFAPLYLHCTLCMFSRLPGSLNARTCLPRSSCFWRSMLTSATRNGGAAAGIGGWLRYFASG
jgi:hypothetical protein